MAYHRAFAQELRGAVAGLPLRPGDRVLDLACGDGVYSRWLAERIGESGRVLSVNISPAFLDLARQGLDGDPPADRVGLVRADLEHLPIPDDSFDLVWCAQSLATSFRWARHGQVRAPPPVRVEAAEGSGGPSSSDG